MPDEGSFIELQIGEAAWLKAARLILAVLALIALLTANTSWVWKLASLIVLMLTFSLIYLQSHRSGGIRVVHLYRNGAVTLWNGQDMEIPAVLEGVPWLTPWVSILSVGRFDRWPRQRLVVCRSNNHPDDYRHMLNCLRLGSAANGILSPR